MTRSTIRLAQICAAALATGILTAALAHSTWAGLVSTDRLLVIVSAVGAVASLGWHGTAAAIERHEERKRAERRHRTPRPDRGTPRPPSMRTRPAEAAPPLEFQSSPEAEHARDPQIEQAFHDFAQRIDPYATPPAPGWMSETEAAQYEDLYAHPSTSST